MSKSRNLLSVYQRIYKKYETKSTKKYQGKDTLEEGTCGATKITAAVAPPLGLIFTGGNQQERKLIIKSLPYLVRTIEKVTPLIWQKKS